MSTADYARVPQDILEAARAGRSSTHPIRSAITGGAAGVAVAALWIFTAWWLAVLAAAVLATWGLWLGSWTHARRSVRRDYRERMTRAGWCWWCHGHHVQRACPRKGL